jgi:hypothetical protein
MFAKIISFTSYLNFTGWRVKKPNFKIPSSHKKFKQYNNVKRRKIKGTKAYY